MSELSSRRSLNNIHTRLSKDTPLKQPYISACFEGCVLTTQADMETNLKYMLIIQSHSTPSRQNEVWLEKFAGVNSVFKTECRTILALPEWRAWHAQTENDVEIAIPSAVANADNTRILELLDSHSDDPYTQADMIAEIHRVLNGCSTKINVPGGAWVIRDIQRMLYTTPDSIGVNSIPSNVMQVACQLLSSADATDFVCVKTYGRVMMYVCNGYSLQMHMHHGKQSYIAWQCIFVNVFTNIICQIGEGDVLERMSSVAWRDYCLDSAVSQLRDILQDIVGENYDTFPHMYEGQLLRAFCALIPKITAALRVCFCMPNRVIQRRITPQFMQAYASLLTHLSMSIDKLQTTVIVAIPDICRLLDSLEVAAKEVLRREVLQNHSKKVACEWFDIKPFFQTIYAFRRQNNLNHSYSARQIVPTIIEAIVVHNLIHDVFSWLFSIVDDEDDDDLCTFVVTQCMVHLKSQNIFDVTASATFSGNDNSSALAALYSVPFIDFIHSVCGPQRPSSRETIAQLSTTRTLEVLMIGVYMDFMKLEKPHTPWCNRHSVEQTIFSGMHAIVQIISSAPNTKSTSLVHTDTRTRDPAIVAGIREKMIHDSSSHSLYSAQILRYHKGDFDSLNNNYTVRWTTDLHTDSHIAVKIGHQLVHRGVTAINLPTLALTAQESALPSIVTIAEHLLTLVL